MGTEQRGFCVGVNQDFCVNKLWVVSSPPCFHGNIKIFGVLDFWNPYWIFGNILRTKRATRHRDLLVAKLKSRVQNLAEEPPARSRPLTCSNSYNFWSLWKYTFECSLAQANLDEKFEMNLQAYFPFSDSLSTFISDPSLSQWRMHLPLKWNPNDESAIYWSRKQPNFLLLTFIVKVTDNSS